MKIPKISENNAVNYALFTHNRRTIHGQYTRNLAPFFVSIILKKRMSLCEKCFFFWKRLRVSKKNINFARYLAFNYVRARGAHVYIREANEYLKCNHNN